MDITTYALLKKKIDSLGISDAKILEVVETFLLAHPEYIGATDEQVAQIVANAAAIQELQAEAVTIVTLDEYNAFTEEQKKEKVYLIWDKDTDNVKADLDVITLDEYNALSEIEKKKRDYLIYSEEEVLIDEVLDENSTRPVQNKVITKEINEIKKSVSDGKKMLAVAITEKGIETASNDSFSIMAANIDSIKALLLQPYIVGNATGYFDTGILFGDLTRVEFDFMYMNTVKDGMSIFGIGENRTYLGSDTRSNGYMGIYYGSGANVNVVRVDAIENDTRFNRVVFDNVSKTISMNGNNVTSISAMTYSPTIPIFAMHDEVFRAFPRSSDAKLYAFRIFDNDIVLRDYVPAKDADGVVCLRDRISGAYLYDATGTNTFGYGEEYVIYKGEL